MDIKEFKEMCKNKKEERDANNNKWNKLRKEQEELGMPAPLHGLSWIIFGKNVFLCPNCEKKMKQTPLRNPYFIILECECGYEYAW